VTIPNSNVTLQFLQCSKSLVSQVGVVDSSTKLIVPGSLLPILQKEDSTWPSYTFPQNDNNSSLVEGDSVSERGANLDELTHSISGQTSSLEWYPMPGFLLHLEDSVLTGDQCMSS
jgi:hypothetical protein